LAQPKPLTVSSPTVYEGSNLEFEVVLDGVTPYTLSYVFSLLDGTATAGSDYDNSNIVIVAYDGNGQVVSGGVVYNNDGTITVLAGVESFKATVETQRDTLAESSETLTLTVGSKTGVGTILDDNVAFSVNDISVNEGAGLLTFTVSRTGNAAASVDFSLQSNTALLNSDVTDRTFDLDQTQTLSFAAGEMTKTVTVSVTNDSVYEGSENFYINLSNASTG